jgi:succinate dehydrogenase/fumarate reductase flavoprotein subunit
MTNTTERECDVLVIGFGGAGAAIAVEAHDLGARVLIVEKTPTPGGNTKVSGGTIRTYLDRDAAIDYIEAVCEGTTPRDVIAAFVDESARNEEWFAKLGASLQSADPRPAGRGFPPLFSGSPFRGVPGEEAVGPRVGVDGPPAVPGAGRRVWNVLERNVAQRQIEVLTEARALELVTANGNEVIGATIEHAGRTVNVRASRATVLACGGFQEDHELQMQHLGDRHYGLGTSANTGDGIRMAQAVGADLWHMSAVASTPGYRPSDSHPIGHHMPAPGFIYVDQRGKRFMDETGVDAHAFWAEVTYADPKSMARPRIPSHVIFTEQTRLAGPIGFVGRGAAGESYEWSADNHAELARGWITSAGSLRELAELLSIDAADLESTIGSYNDGCAEGSDHVFGRDRATLEPIIGPPFYAIEIWPCLFNTQGGPRRDASGHVLDPFGRPIPRLYSAGELGSLWHRFYPGAGNLSEALASGRIAGRNAVAERPFGG